MQNTTDFIAACSTWPRTANSLQRINQCIQAVDDWDSVFKSVLHHRVVALVHSAIEPHKDAIPEKFRLELKEKALLVTVQSMMQAKETVRLHAQFIAAGIDAVQFKGASLGQMAYGSIALKSASDIDIYVPPVQAIYAIELMEQQGYRYKLTSKKMPMALKKSLMQLKKDAPMLDKRGHQVELHWKFSGFPGLLTELEKSYSTTTVDIDRFGSVQTMERIDLFTYLCVHGAVHNWHRLKWLADFNAFMSHMSMEEKVQAMDYAAKKGAGVAVSQAMQLCAIYFHTPLPEFGWLDTKALVSISCKRIEQSAKPQTRQGKFLSYVKNFTVHWRLFKPASKAVGLLYPRLVSTVDIILIPLPRFLHWVYPVIRVPLFLIRRGAALLKALIG